jgi:hypothetical protein
MFKNLLQWLTELRKTLYLCLQAYYKGYNLGTEKWKKLIGQGMWGKEFSILSSAHHPPGTLMFHQLGSSLDPVT